MGKGLGWGLSPENWVQNSIVDAEKPGAQGSAQLLARLAARALEGKASRPVRGTDALKVGRRVDAGGKGLVQDEDRDLLPVPERAKLLEAFRLFNRSGREIGEHAQEPGAIGVEPDVVQGREMLR